MSFFAWLFSRFPRLRPIAVPRGKGLTVPGPPGARVSRYRDPDAFADRMQALGVQWVALPGEHYSGQSTAPEQWYDANLGPLGQALRARGIQPVIFGYVYPGDGELSNGNPQPSIEAQIDRLVRSAKLAGATVIRLNAERQWRAPRGSATLDEYNRIAAAMVAELKRRGYVTILSSYGGGPPNHPGFPWAGFAGVDVGSPQLYSQPATREARGRRVGWWREVGYAVIDPTVGLEGDRDDDLSVAQRVQIMIDEALNTPYDNALAFWSWYLIDNEQAMADAYARILVPPGGVAMLAGEAA